MAIKSNMQNFTPSKERFKQEIKLLSHGYSCPTAFPGGLITVYPWDVDVDAWVAERAQRAKKSLFMWDLLERVCNLNGCPVDNFVVGDASTVMLVSRAISHQNVVEYTAKCPAPLCGHSRRDTIRVPDELEKIGEKSDTYSGWDEIELPNCKDKVKVRPLVIGDIKKIEDRPEISRQKISDRLCRILAVVVDINNTTPDVIEELVSWYEALHPQDKKFFSDQQDLLYPHLNTQLDYTCEKCAHEFSIPLQFNDAFFR
jgi:hypothetical protein